MWAWTISGLISARTRRSWRRIELRFFSRPAIPAEAAGFSRTWTHDSFTKFFRSGLISGFQVIMSIWCPRRAKNPAQRPTCQLSTSER